MSNAPRPVNVALCGQGTEPTTPTSDGIFSDGVTYQMCTVTQNATTGVTTPS